MLIHIRKYRVGIMLGLIFAFLPFFYRQGVQEKQLQPPPLYGEFLTWDEVQKVFPLYDKATVIDYDTGLEFVVQRRGGHYHADVQPLSADDSAIMKEIYHGKWSWRRRAVMVELDDGQRIAGSMHGMPHGSGAIKGNNFNGHFCIHFRNSITHGSRKKDLAHQMMVWKAANQIESQLKDLEADKIIRIFFTALDQGDRVISSRIICSRQYKTEVMKNLDNIHSIQMLSLQNAGDNTYKVDVKLVFADASRPHRRQATITLYYPPPNSVLKESYWQIDPASLLSLFEKQGN